MKLDIREDNTELVIIPETAFEIVWLKKFCKAPRPLQAEAVIAGNGNDVICVRRDKN